MGSPTTTKMLVGKRMDVLPPKKRPTNTSKAKPVEAVVVSVTPKKKKAVQPAPVDPQQQISVLQAEIDRLTKAKKKKITIKESKLIAGVVAGKSKRAAAAAAGYKGSLETLSVTASKVLKKANVQEAMELALEKHDLTPDRIAGVVAEAMGATRVMIIGNGEDAMADVQPDHGIRLRAADMASKFMGVNKEDKPEGNTTYIFNQQNNNGVTGLGEFMRP